MSRKPTKGIDYTNRDYEAYRELMIQKLKEKMPEYTDTSSTDAGIVILECLANGLDILSMYSDIVANDVLLPTTQDRRMACILARNLGYTPYNQTASITPQVFVLNKAKEEQYTIPKGTVVTTEVEDGREAIVFETVESRVIPAGCLGDEKDDNGNYLYAVNVVHGSTVTNDLVGTSTGAPYQSFKLNFANVIPDTITLMINEGEGDKEWKQVDSFLSREITGESEVYTVIVDEFDMCYIEFGNGIYGKIPSVFPNGISASYRIGGGEIGNVQANTITVLESVVPSIDITFNPVDTVVKGHEKETLDEIRNNAPASFKTRDRAVTLSDYSDLIRVNNKGNLFAIYNSIALRDSQDGMLVHLYYQMRTDYTMTESLEKEILDFFSTRTVIGAKLELKPYEPYNIKIEANLIVDRDYVQTEVEQNVKDYIEQAFFYEGAFTFKDEFLKTDLENEIMSTISGVRSFRISSPVDDIIVADEDYKIITLNGITLKTTGGKV